MIIFDYGQTLINQLSFNPLKGTIAVLEHAKDNSNAISAEIIQDFANQLSEELGRTNPNPKAVPEFEIHNFQFQRYLYDYFGIQFDLSSEVIERLFVNAAFELEPTENIIELLNYLELQGIRTAVLSNISFSGLMLTEIISKHIPSHYFEFILASSDYIFRKPNQRIFELSLRKAGLEAKDVWYCGDNGYCDVEGAMNAGIFPVWYKGEKTIFNDFQPSIPVLQVEDWQQLITILDKLKES